MNKPESDSYFKKIVTHNQSTPPLKFRTAQDLFSSHQVDVGSARLLRSLDETALPSDAVLDVGCGYGPLGLTLKAEQPTRRVHLVDRDALALAYTRQNAALNGLAGVEVYGSLGYDAVTRRDFDLVISNIPGKAGEPVIESLLVDARHYLRPGGWVAVVVVAPLAPLVDTVLAAAEAEIRYREVRSGHAIYHYSFAAAEPSPPSATGLERGLYHRDTVEVSEADLAMTLETARGLPEFDSLSYETRVLFKMLDTVDVPREARVMGINPGQGYVPVALWQRWSPAHITLADRDLLSLHYAARNLASNGCPPERVTQVHCAGVALDAPLAADLIAGVLRESEGEAAIAQTVRQAAAHLAPGGQILLAGSSTAITRIVKGVQADKLLTVKKRKRVKGGKSALLLEN